VLDEISLRVYDWDGLYAKKDIYYFMNIKAIEKKAEIFQILSHPVRLQILNELRKREACVCHLQAITKRPQAYVSQQLRILREADLVIDEKDGQNVYYHLHDEMVLKLLEDTLGPAEPPKFLFGCNCPFCQARNT